MRWITTFGLVGIAASTAMAQNLVSAKAGLVHYAEGDVVVAGKAVEQKISLFTTIKPGETLTTAEGRAEVLLGPGVILRVAENSNVKLVNNDVTDTRVELISGTVIVEAADTVKENRTTILHKGATVVPKKDGLYTIETGPTLSVRTWDGEADVIEDGQTTEVKGGRIFNLDGVEKAQKFDKDDTDALYRWAKRRSSYLAMASISGARSADRWNYNSGISNWLWNPYMNMYTFIPRRGIWTSPFGWSYYSPAAVYAVFSPSYGSVWGGGNVGPSIPRYNPNLGYSTVPMRSPGGVMSGNGGGGGASAAPSAPASRGSLGGGAVGRPGGGGRGN